MLDCLEDLLEIMGLCYRRLDETTNSKDRVCGIALLNVKGSEIHFFANYSCRWVLSESSNCGYCDIV